MRVRRRSSLAGRRRASSPKRAREVGGDARERLACAQALAAHEVQADVAVAEDEPVDAAQLGHDRHRLARVAGHAPALLGMDAAGQRVEQRVEVGRDRQSPVLEVVADVADDRDVGGRQAREQPAREARPADAACEDGHPRHAAGASPRSPGRVDVALDAGQPHARAAVALRAAGPVAGRNALGGHAAIAFVVPSAAATSASGRACAINSRTSSAVTSGRSPASTAMPVAPACCSSASADALGEVAPAVVQHVGAERARSGMHLGVRRDDADLEAGLEAGLHDPPHQEQHEVRARSPSSTSARRDLPRGSALTGTSASHPPWERATIGPSL